MSSKNITIALVIVGVFGLIGVIRYRAKQKVLKTYNAYRAWLQDKTNKAIRAYKNDESSADNFYGASSLLSYYAGVQEDDYQSFKSYLRAQVIWYTNNTEKKQQKITAPEWFVKNVTSDAKTLQIDSHKKSDDFIKYLANAVAANKGSINFKSQKEYLDIIRNAGLDTPKNN